MTSNRIRVIAGTGRYTDPWHRFVETSQSISGVLTGLGHQVEVLESTPEAFTELSGIDLVVVNCGGNPEVDLPADPTWQAAFDSFAAWIGSGNPILGVHAAANAFPDWRAWPELLGGRWVRGRSHHPPRTEFTFDAAPGSQDHPALGGLQHVTVVDERYSDLEVSDRAVPLLEHVFDDRDHVMVWAIEDAGRKAVYDGLGHGPESYESSDRRQLLASEVGWLLDRT